MSENKTMNFEEFERDWKRKHKTSIPRKVHTSSAREYFWIAFWIIVATGAAIFSAAHTIPAAELTILKDVVNRGQLAVTAFVIVELVIFGAAAGRREIEWLKWLLIGSVLVALAGNISSSYRAVWDNGGDWLNQFGGFLLAIIAPLTALAAGEVLHIQLDKRAVKRRAAQAEFDVKFKDMEAKILQAHTRYEKEHKPQNIAETDVSLRKMTAIDRPSPKMKRAVEWLREHPEHMETESRVLAGLIGVSHTLANDAKKHILRQGKRYVNGQSDELAQ